MPLENCSHNSLNVLVEIANKMGLQKENCIFGEKVQLELSQNNNKTNSVALSPQANYTN
jgi:hypothetical protein